MNAPISHLPPAARRQVKAANAAIAAMRAGAAPPVQPVAPVAASAAPPAALPSNIPNIGVNFGPEWHAATPEPAAPVGEPAPQPAALPAAPAVSAEPAAPADTYEQRYRVLEGKYRVEAQRTNRLIEQQSQMIEQLRSQPAAAAAPAASVAPTDPKLRLKALGATDEQIKDFGADLLELMAIIATNASNATVQPMVQRVDQVSRQVGANNNMLARTAQQIVWDALAKEVGADWELINNSPEFVDWINVPDVFSGQARRVGLMQAFEAGDAARVVQIFKAFKKEDASGRGTARTPQVDPATLLAPGQPRVENPAAPANGASGKIWSESEVRDFYSRVQRGRITVAEKKETEAEIALAMKQGRIRPDQNFSHLANNP